MDETATGEWDRLPGFAIPKWVDGLAIGVGKEIFGTCLIDALSVAIDAEDCAAFQYNRSGVHTLAVGSVRNVKNTRLAAQRYQNEFWKRDRFLLAHRVQTQLDGLAIYNIAAKQIADKQFRRNCYEFQDVTEQTSVQFRLGSDVYALSAFWGARRQRAGVRDFEKLATAASTLMSFVVRHAEITQPSARPAASPLGLSNAEGLVRQLTVGLTARELEVCARILRGMTMHGIAIDLGLSVHSVVTYKRRAFQRLSIATTVELFSLCMPAATSPPDQV
jgi:DNA-binding CsgD family transcriptional regulator